MKNKFCFLLLSLLVFHSGCKNSTQLDNTIVNATVTMRTDSLQYVRSIGRANVIIRINNKTDSTIIFPSCTGISKRIDVKQGNVWSAGFPEWDSPCQAIYRIHGSMEKDAWYSEIIHIDTTGTFRVVTIYGLSRGSYTDTLFSNEFMVL